MNNRKEKNEDMNRTGTYVAFDGLGQTDPTKSDFKYYSMLQAWSVNKNMDFHLIDSHTKTYAVRDTSTKATLYARIRQRLSASKNMVVVLSSNTRKTGSVLSYEIEQAIDVYKIPLIIAYPEYDAIWGVNSGSDLEKLWPNALKSRIDISNTQAIHIPFKKEPLLDAIPRFTVNGEDLSNGRNVYSRDTYVQWGLLEK